MIGPDPLDQYQISTTKPLLSSWRCGVLNYFSEPLLLTGFRKNYIIPDGPQHHHGGVKLIEMARGCAHCKPQKIVDEEMQNSWRYR